MQAKQQRYRTQQPTETKKRERKPPRKPKKNKDDSKQQRPYKNNIVNQCKNKDVICYQYT